MMDIRPLASEADYDWALREVEKYFENEPELDTPEAARFDILSALIEHYESKIWPIETPDPIEAIRMRMEEKGLRQTDLAALLGSRSRASEILSRRRALTMEQAYKLNREWHIPAEILLQPYHLQR